MGRRVQKIHRNKGGKFGKAKGKRSHKRLFLLILGFILLGIPFLYTVVDQEVVNIASVNNDQVDAKIKAEGTGLIIEEDKGFTLTPDFKEPVKGIIIYPHSGISPKAYVPLGMLLAKKGYLVVIPEFLLNRPGLEGNVIRDIIKDHESVGIWTIAGHGSGGETMSAYLKDQEKIKGAIFMASYPGEKVDLSNTSLKVVSIAGSLDGVMDQKLYESRKTKLPAGAMFVKIEGGNFSYFANYSDESGAEITREDQQVQTSVQIFNLLDQLR